MIKFLALCLFAVPIIAMELEHEPQEIIPLEEFLISDDITYNHLDNIHTLCLAYGLSTEVSERRFVQERIMHKLLILAYQKNETSFLKLHELENLNVNIGYNNLTDIPEKLTALTNLTSLNIEGNLLGENKDILHSLPQTSSFTYLNVSKNTLKILPLEFCIPNLKILSLHHNKLKKLPSQIKFLSSLTILDISNNKLHKLPKVIESLSQLKKLNLKKNKLKVLPPAIGKLTALITLYLQKNALEVLPLELSSLSNLQYLDISKNNLSTTKEGFLGLQRQFTNVIIDLNLSYNKLNEIPSVVAILTNLSSLNLSFNWFQNSIIPIDIFITNNKKLVLEFTIADNNQIRYCADKLIP